MTTRVTAIVDVVLEIKGDIGTARPKMRRRVDLTDNIRDLFTPNTTDLAESIIPMKVGQEAEAAASHIVAALKRARGMS